MGKFEVIGKGTPKVDDYSIVTGRAKYTDDFKTSDTLFGKLLLSPHAHAEIVSIDKTRALKVKGVKAVLTHNDVPRVAHTTAGQAWPEPSPYDTFMLDNKVRFVGDRVAAVAAETPQAAEKALKLIKVNYKILPAVLDYEKAMAKGTPQIHDEKDSKGIADPSRNLAAKAFAEIGNVDEGFKNAWRIFENTYRVGYIHAAPMENHTTICQLDENGRLKIITTTQVPWHVRRIVAQCLNVPENRIRVIKPRIGGCFGVKQEILLEDICAALCMATKMPVRMEFNRKEEFTATRTRHPMLLTVKTALDRNNRIIANELKLLANTGAYGSHALTVPCNTGSKSLPLYDTKNQRFIAEVVYTNMPVAGAVRGYGAPEGHFAMESHMDEIAHAIGMDPAEFRELNRVREGQTLPLLAKLGEGKPGFEQQVRTCALGRCISMGKEKTNWDKERKKGKTGKIRTGIGMAILMQGSGIPGVDMGSATIKLNDDGSFTLLVGATDLGTGSDTVLSQIAAETLGVSLDKILIYSSDTDFTPYDSGAYASSTTYISGNAVLKAAAQLRQDILKRAAKILKVSASSLYINRGIIRVKTGKKHTTLKKVATDSLYTEDQAQLMASASFSSLDCPPPYAAHFAKVSVDTETGIIKVLDYVACVDCGRALNPPQAEGQTEGGIMMGLGYALCEEMKIDKTGRIKNPNFMDYKIFTFRDMPDIKTILVENPDIKGPYGAKSVSELPTNGPAPCIANAIYDAIGVRFREIPITPEKVLKALEKK